MRDEMAQRQKALEAEQEELTQRVQRGNIEVFTAVGQLRPSSLQVGSGQHTLFRLVDPDTQRTVIYLQARGEAEESLRNQLDRFIGVRGDVLRDSDLEMKYVKVTESKIVDVEELFGNVAAKIIPPSMIDPAGDEEVNLDDAVAGELPPAQAAAGE